MKNYKTPALIASILLAVSMPLMGAVKAQKDLSSYPIVRFDIEPYDPRDLLYGHYMTFRIKWNWVNEQVAPKTPQGDACLCVGEGSINPPVSVINCDAAGDALPSCRYTIKGKYYPGFAPVGQQPAHFFDVDVNRYYVDEAVALPLEKLFRAEKARFSIGLGMKPHGKPIVEKLYVDDVPLLEYLKAQGGKILEIDDSSTQP